MENINAIELLDQIKSSISNIKDLIILNYFPHEIEQKYKKSLNEIFKSLNSVELYLVKQIKKQESKENICAENDTNVDLNEYKKFFLEDHKENLPMKDKEIGGTKSATVFDDFDDDIVFMKQVNILETSLNNSISETPLQSAKKSVLTPFNNVDKNNIQQQKSEPCKKSLRFASDSQSSEDQLLNDFMEAKSDDQFFKQENISSDKINESDHLEKKAQDGEITEADQKYVQILKRYFGYSSFRKSVNKKN
jgi:hypothetical protein